MIRLDAPTLLIVTCVTTFLVGALFVLSWRQAPSSRALALWGAAHLAGAVASAGLALRGVLSDVLTIGVANAVMLAAYGLLWSGVRAFEGRAFQAGPTLAGAAAWCALCLDPAFYGSLEARVVFASAVAALYCAAAAAEVWRGRAERLASRIVAAIVLGLHGLCYLARIPATLLIPLPPGINPMASAWVAILCFAAMLFSIASAFTFMALVKERAERTQRIAARTDPLTGVANRRAFLERASAALSGGQAALLLIDLDRFKAVNDTYGHAVGDAVLVGFCTVAAAVLPAEAPLGRLGGEEFGCLLPDAPPGEALARAEILRRAFAGLGVPELPALSLSASIGVAQAGVGSDIDTLMREADAALYAAKARGRDRVEVAGARRVQAA